jgi:hypothetical protein
MTMLAGSWYDGDADTLQETLSGFFKVPSTQPTGSDKAPRPTPPSRRYRPPRQQHPPPSPRNRRSPCGHSYSGPTAAYTRPCRTKLTTATIQSPIHGYKCSASARSIWLCRFQVPVSAKCLRRFVDGDGRPSIGL